ncbi:hypothetical protein [Ramlibacter sp. Leaf400]|uniref:hypothetical protein n=1 Tax=Ramlibacter sp. Leaf400 TaxID=1736365 RepID=UPI0006FE5BF8|nr:hypothetical protein [Ramlibacter sp. Leaf400]KQT11260.1 hypothetical protein ASG30_05095 [Ramlibacter sp. Leaf400]
MLKLNAVLLASALAGCSTPISQGGKSEIVSAANETIRMRWNPQLTNEREMRSVAIAFCGGRDVDELQSLPDTDASSGLQAKTWRCKLFPGFAGGR